MKRKTADSRKKAAKKKSSRRKIIAEKRGADFTQTGAEERDEMQSEKK